MKKARLLLALVLTLVLSQPVFAGIADLFNGVTVGKQLPAHDFKYIGVPPDANAKLQLIEFWATWCGPCVAEIPKLNGWHERYKSQGLVVIGVTRETSEVVTPFLVKTPMKYAIALEQKQVLHDKLKIRVVPYAIFTSRTGKIVWRGAPSSITEQLIESLLN